MLKIVGSVNKLSTSLHKKLEERIKGFGNKVTYRFEIGKQNMDREAKGDDATIFNLQYTLDPRVFEIFDEGEKEGSKYKTICIVKSTKMNVAGNLEVDVYGKIVVKKQERGVKVFYMNNKEDAEMVWFLECHPKLSGGLFEDKNKNQIVFRIDEASNAKTQIATREARRKAESFAANMTESEILDFAQSMAWDVNVDPLLLKDKVEQEAEKNSVSFNDLVAGEDIKYRSVVFKAISKEIIRFDPSTYGFYWKGNEQLITILSPNGEGTANNKFANWLQTNDTDKTVFKKIKSLVETR
jgi:hypothetical protein